MSGIPHEHVVLRGFDVTALYPGAASELINELNYHHHRQFFNNVSNEALNSNYWHKFTIVTNPNCREIYTKFFLLCLITKFVSPTDLLPLYVVQKSDKLIFVARNCLEAMKKLCEAKLSLPNPLEPEYPFTIIIVKQFTSIRSLPVVNVEENIRQVLKKRQLHGSLDLSKFHEDNDLKEFCPLFQPKVLLYILSLATEHLETVFKIVLCNNDIQKLPHFESLDCKEFKAIDLGSNKIHKIEDIVPLKDVPQLVWLRLDDNPLCGCFNDGLTYFLYVKTICKKLESLDTNRLCNDGFFKKHRTFLCNEKGYDFASQFIENYYIHFDKSFDTDIGSFYHVDAMFSLTHTLYNKKLTPIRIESRWLSDSRMRNRMKFFYDQDRNILQGREENFLRIGRSAIEYMFEKYLPPIKHNPHTFSVDLMYYTKKSAIVSVTGVFEVEDSKEFAPGRTTCGFLRTFALSSSDGKEWLITNDQWNIYAPYRLQNSLPPMPKKNETMCTFPHPDQNKIEELDALTQTFQSITELTYEHSKKFLLKNGWNLEVALQDFMDAHINNEIPDNAFGKENPSRQNSESSIDEINIENDMLLPMTKLLEQLASSASEAPSCSN